MNKGLIACTLTLFVLLSTTTIIYTARTRDHEREVKAFKESRQEMCDRFALVVNGSARAASQKIEERYEVERQDRLRTDLPLLIVMSDGCVELPEPTRKASEGGDLKHGVLSLDYAMSVAKSKGWPLVK